MQESTDRLFKEVTKTIDDMYEKLNKDIEIIKKNQIWSQNTNEWHKKYN